MSNFYRWPGEKQKEWAHKNLIKYVKNYIYPYHPYLRKLYQEKGIDPAQLRDYSDIQKIPTIEKADYRKDTLAFILQPKFPGREKMALYDTDYISKKLIFKYVLQAIFNYPKDHVHKWRKMDFKEGKVGRRAALEWMPMHFHASAGSTGDPTPALYTHYEFRNVLPELCANVYLEPDNRHPDDPLVLWDSRLFNLFPGAPHLAFFQAVITKILTGFSSFDTFGGKVIPTEHQIRLFAQGKFNHVSTMPSYFTYWLRKAVEMREKGEIPDLPQFEGGLCAGEPMTREQRKYFKELAKMLGAHPRFRVIEGMGMTESKWAFMECDEETGIHLNPKFYLWEMLDPETRKPVPEGEPGVLTFSHIGWRGTAFIRYYTGDLIRGGMRWDKCPKCGYTYPRITGPIQRAVKDFTKIKGTRVSLSDLIATVRDMPGVSSFQVVIDKEIPGDQFSRDVLKLRITPQPDAKKEALERRLKEKVKGVTEVTPDQIIWEDDEKKLEADLFERTGIKADYIVDKRPVHI